MLKAEFKLKQKLNNSFVVVVAIAIKIKNNNNNNNNNDNKFQYLELLSIVLQIVITSEHK